MQHTDVKTVRICFFGDSFTNGTGDDTCLGWVGRVCAMHRSMGHDVTMYNLGVRRDTSVDIAARWEAEAKARLPQGIAPRLVFAFGNNDTAMDDLGIAPRLTLQQSLTAAQNIMNEASKWAPTFVIGPVPVFDNRAHQDRIVGLSDALAILCQTLCVPFLNLTKLPEVFWRDWRREALQGDGVHPNSKGYEQLAKVVSDWKPLTASIVTF